MKKLKLRILQIKMYYLVLIALVKVHKCKAKDDLHFGVTYYGVSRSLDISLFTTVKIEITYPIRFNSYPSESLKDLYIYNINILYECITRINEVNKEIVYG